MRIRRSLPIAWALAILYVAAAPARADEPEIRIHTYSICGATAAELRAQMAANDPEGWWAYTQWYVRWTGDCQVSLSIDYTMPTWEDENEAPAELQAAWNRMIDRLWLHEQGHGRHGLEAAKEIIQSGCEGNPRDITDKWAEQDRVYDRETNHGVRQGVSLP